LSYVSQLGTVVKAAILFVFILWLVMLCLSTIRWLCNCWSWSLQRSSRYTPCPEKKKLQSSVN